MVNGIGVGKHRVQERGGRFNLRKYRAHLFRDSIHSLSGIDREIKDLRSARDPNPARAAFAADEWQARGIAIDANLADSRADAVGEQQERVAGRCHHNLLARQVRRNDPSDFRMSMRRHHDEDEIGTGKGSAGAIGDQRKSSKTLTKHAFVFNATYRGERLGRRMTAAKEANIESALRELRGRRASAVSGANNGNALNSAACHYEFAGEAALN